MFEICMPLKQKHVSFGSVNGTEIMMKRHIFTNKKQQNGSLLCHFGHGKVGPSRDLEPQGATSMKFRTIFSMAIKC